MTATAGKDKETRKRNPHSLLAGVETGVVTVEIIVATSQNTKNV